MSNKRPKGRPTKYRPEYCEMLIEHMSKGYSYQSFASVAKVNIDTLYEWEKMFEDFTDAKKRGYADCLFFWEKLAIENTLVKNGKPVLNTGSFVFNMKNRFGWSDKQEVDVTSGNINIELVKKSNGKT